MESKVDTNNSTNLNVSCYFCNSALPIDTLLGKAIKYCQPCYIKEQETYKEIVKYQGYPSINQITDKIYLGNLYGSLCKEELKLYEITHVLVCIFGMHKPFPEDFQYKLLEMLDDEREDLTLFLKEALLYIDNAGKIYIHCQAGVSRSSSVVIAYLMWKNRLTYLEAKRQVKEKRKCVCPNDTFEKQLKEFENYLKDNDYEL